jgi:peroxisomal coenzyme A diphosphatase NUDT7
MRSKAAIARLRTYRPPPFTLWDRLPVNKRAAVLILLYADRRGDLRVVITMRAASLRNFAGHAAFPGGKADTLQETPCTCAPLAWNLHRSMIFRCQPFSSAG